MSNILLFNPDCNSPEVLKENIDWPNTEKVLIVTIDKSANSNIYMAQLNFRELCFIKCQIDAYITDMFTKGLTK